MRGICFGNQKLLNRFRNQSGEPDILVRNVSRCCSLKRCLTAAFWRKLVGVILSLLLSEGTHGAKR